MTDVERKKMIHQLLIEVKVILKWVKCFGSCISPGYATVCTDRQGLIMTYGVSRNSVESMKLVIQTEETDLMLFVNSLKLSCQK